MSNLRDDILRLIATAKPSAADCIAVPVSVGALYAARMDIEEDVFIGMCRRALVSARRLAGEAQRKYRESGLLLLDEIRQKLAMMDERDQLRVDRDRQLAALAEMRESLRAFADSAAKERDALMGEVAKHRARAAELEAERAKANEPRPMITTIKGQAPRLEFAADGQPITYVTPQPEPASDNQGALRYDDFKPTRYL